MCFTPPISEAILKISLSQSPHFDKLTWREKPNGSFSIRNVYRLIQSHNTKQVGENSSTPNPNPLWKAIWKINTPHKIKFFSWRACGNGLLCSQHLKRKNIEVKGMCAFCQNQEEDISSSSGRRHYSCSISLSYLLSDTAKMFFCHVCRLRLRGID